MLGPEAPLIALGGGFTLLMVTQLKRDAPQQMLLVLGAAGSFAAISMIFQSPLVAAVLVIEASGLGGPTLPLILLPGLLAAGIGSLTFIGISNWGALDTSAYSLGALPLPPFASPTWAEVGWSVVLAVVAAVLVFAIRRGGLKTVEVVTRRPYLVVPAAGAVVPSAVPRCRRRPAGCAPAGPLDHAGGSRGHGRHGGVHAPAASVVDRHRNGAHRHRRRRLDTAHHRQCRHRLPRHHVARSAAGDRSGCSERCA
ncbi:MAG TPA: chloride channel protein [Acidimicrobiales bacterium]